MAVKISGLIAGSPPLSGGELFEIVQGANSRSAPVSAVDHNTLSGLQGGITSAGEYYHLSQSIHDGLYSASPTIGVGVSGGTNLEVDYGGNIINTNISGSLLSKATSAGLDINAHAAIGNAADLSDDTILNIQEDLNSASFARGTTLTVENLASDAGAWVIGNFIQLINQTSTAHSKIIGQQVLGATGNNSGGAAVTTVTGIKAIGSLIGDNSTVTEVMGGHFTAETGFSMVAASASKMTAGEFHLLALGSGDISVTDGYGILVRTPAFTPTGTLTNLYGLYIEDQSNSGFTNDYNIYSAGASASNAFEGTVFTDKIKALTHSDGASIELTVEAINDGDIIFSMPWHSSIRGQLRFQTDGGDGRIRIIQENSTTGAPLTIGVAEGPGISMVNGSYTSFGYGTQNTMRTAVEGNYIGIRIDQFTDLLHDHSVTKGFVIHNRESSGTVTVSANNSLGNGTTLAVFHPDTKDLTLNAGVGVSEFSSDGTMAGDSDTAVPTEKAVKTYVDVNVTTETAQVTASHNDIVLADGTGGVFTVYLQESTNAMVRVKKVDAVNNITVEGLSGNIDGAANKVLTSQYESLTFVWDGSNWFIV